MSEFLLYELKTAVALAVFYIFYRLSLSRETFHRFNRIVLLFTALLAFVLPFCVITVHNVVTLPTPAVQTVPTQTIVAMAEAGLSIPWWQIALTVVFIAGAAVALCTTLFSILKVWRLIFNGEKHHLETDEILVVTDMDVAPFSWMKYIVISRADYENRDNHECGFCEIITHERAHITLHHSWDLLFVNFLTLLQWFNPAIWMLKSDLKALHEFEADDAVLRSGVNVRQYQYLLVKKAVGMSGYSIANSFNHSTLKQRITMMLSKKSSSMSALKALYIIPLVGMSLAATARTVTDVRYDDAQSDTEPAIVYAQQDTMILFVDGKKVPYETYAKIDPADVHSVTVSKQTTVITPSGEEKSLPTIDIVTKEAFARTEAELAQAEAEYVKAKENFDKATENIPDSQAEAAANAKSGFVTVRTDDNVSVYVSSDDDANNTATSTISSFVASTGDSRLIRVFSDSVLGSKIETKIMLMNSNDADSDNQLPEDVLVVKYGVTGADSAGLKGYKSNLALITKDGTLNPSDYIYVVNGKVIKLPKNASAVTILPPASSFSAVSVRRDPDTLKKYKAKNKKGVLFITTK
ncbi:MAG: M56 family metallopeptidase [Candidatus Aphodosoma sp.]